MTYPDISLEALPCDTDGFRVVVLVLLDLETTVSNDRAVVCPGLVGQVDGLVREEPGQEGQTDSESTSTGDGLSCSDSAFLQRLRVFTVRELDGCVDEFGKTGNGEVFLVMTCLSKLLFGFLHEEA